MVCFNKTVKVPGKPGDPLTARQATEVIIALYSLDRAKSACGKRLLRFYGVKL